MGRRNEIERARREDKQERKAVIMRFLDATQKVEELIDGQEARIDAAPSPGTAHHELHEMWLSVKEVIISCDKATGTAADVYCNALQRRIRAQKSQVTKREARWEFLKAARLELGAVDT